MEGGGVTILETEEGSGLLLSDAAGVLPPVSVSFLGTREGLRVLLKHSSAAAILSS